MNALGLLGATIGLMFAVTSAHAQFARQEIHPLPSVDISGTEFLTGKTGTPTIIAGHLRLPKTGEKLPAVILVHGLTGLGGAGYIEEWARTLNGMVRLDRFREWSMPIEPWTTWRSTRWSILRGSL